MMLTMTAQTRHEMVISLMTCQLDVMIICPILFRNPLTKSKSGGIKTIACTGKKKQDIKIVTVSYGTHGVIAKFHGS